MICAWEAWSEGEVDAAGPVADQTLREELLLRRGRRSGHGRRGVDLRIDTLVLRPRPEVTACDREAERRHLQMRQPRVRRRGADGQLTPLPERPGLEIPRVGPIDVRCHRRLVLERGVVVVVPLAVLERRATEGRREVESEVVALVVEQRRDLEVLEDRQLWVDAEQLRRIAVALERGQR